MPSFIARHHERLRQQLSLNAVVSALLSKGVLTPEDMDEIYTKKSNISTYAARDHLLLKLMAKTKAKLLVFVDVLAEHNEDLAREMALSEEQHHGPTPAQHGNLESGEVVLRVLRNAVAEDFPTLPVAERCGSSDSAGQLSYPAQCTEGHASTTTDTAAADTAAAAGGAGVLEPLRHTVAGNTTAATPRSEMMTVAVPVATAAAVKSDEVLQIDENTVPTFLSHERVAEFRSSGLDPWKEFVQPVYVRFSTAMGAVDITTFCFQHRMLTPSQRISVQAIQDATTRNDSLLHSLFSTHWLGFCKVMAYLQTVEEFGPVLELITAHINRTPSSP
eukprot:scpid53486/ scgid34816/ 